MFCKSLCVLLFKNCVVDIVLIVKIWTEVCSLSLRFCYLYNTCDFSVHAFEKKKMNQEGLQCEGQCRYQWGGLERVKAILK